jgi:hypothetical protein
VTHSWTDKSVFKFFVLTAPFLLFLNVLSFETKNALGGIGTNVFFAVMLVVFVLSLHRMKLADKGLKILLFIVIFVAVKNVLYRYGGTQLGAMILLSRNYLIFAFYYYLGIIYLGSEIDRRNVLKFIVVILIASLVISTLHYNFFYHVPFIDLTYATNETSGAILYLKDVSIMRFRETSIFFGPNVYAYMLVFGYICYYFRMVGQLTRARLGKALEVTLVTLFVIYGLIQTDSRSALFLLFIFITANVVKGRDGVLLKVVVPIVVAVVAAGLMAYSQRFSLALALSDPRFAKMFEAYLLLNQAAANWIVGLPGGSPWTTDALEFSDNQYGALMLEGGVVLVLAWIVFVRHSLKNIARLRPGASLYDQNYLSAVKFSLVFFMLYGFFAIPIGMASLFNYLGLLLGGATRIAMNSADAAGRTGQ